MEVLGCFGLKRGTSFLVILLIAVAALVYLYFGVHANTEGVNTALTFALVIATTLYAAILFWDHWTDVPQLEIQTKDIKISKKLDFYSIKVPVLNNGRRDAIDWRGRIQIFNQECGNKVYDSEINNTSSPNDEKIVSGGTASFEVKLPSFKGSFVAEIVVSTHKSEDVKIIEIDNTSEDIAYKCGTWKTRSFEFKKHFIGDYRNNWDVDLFENGLEEFEDSSAIKQVVKMLGQTGDVSAVDPLAYRLKRDPVDRIRREAASALGELKYERAVKPLIEHLQNKSVFGACVDALVKIFEEVDGKNYVETFTKILEDGDRTDEDTQKIVNLLCKIGKNTGEETVGTIEESLIGLLENAEKKIEQFIDSPSNILSPIVNLEISICKALGEIGSTEEALNVVKDIEDGGRISDKEEITGKIERRIQKRKGAE
jgi:hypothetical protein